MEFRILGPIEVDAGAGPVALGGAKLRALLTVLLLRANEPVSAEHLALALWGVEAPAGAVKTVQAHIWRLRKALGAEGPLETTPAGYRLRVRPGELDAEHFERLVEDGRQALAAGYPDQAGAVLRQALSLWRGPPLADLAFESFAQAEIARLEEQRLGALEERAEADLAAGRHGELVSELQRLVAAHPTRERLAGQLILALYRCGRQAEALEAYREARRVLVEEIGVEPGPQLRRLHEAVLRHDPNLELQPEVAELPRELAAVTAPPIAGRDRELTWLRDRFEETRRGTGAVVALVGPRGIGKSRLAAEVAAQAHLDGATVLYCTGAEPAQATLATLARARAGTRPALLVLDDADRSATEVLTGLHARASSRASPASSAPRGRAGRERREAPVLVLACAEDAAALEPLDADETLTLAPLERRAVGTIAAAYAPGRGDVEVPAQWLLEASGGIPGRVHEVAAQWAQREAARRVETVAGLASSGRTRLRSMESELAGGIVELQAARERVVLLGDGEPAVVCPFKGLAAFEAADAQFFFGREGLVADLVARLVGAPLLGVIGPSGSGKSSVMRAGLLPALASGVLPGSERWAQIVMRPGEHPLRELRDAVAGVGGDQRVVLAVDQFEETFTTCRDEQERARFIAELVRAAHDSEGRGVVAIAVRVDYYGRCAAYPELSGLLAANHVLVRPMRRNELRRAIEHPARRAGLRVEPELADALVADVEGEPGGLPLFSTALLELWQRRDGRRLRHATYERTGGVRGAVARLAEDAFAKLDPAQQDVARGVLLRLAGEGVAGAVVRRRVPLAELESWRGEDVTRVVTSLTDRRLLTTSAGTVEVAHEALLREWPRLRGWLEEDADGRRLHRHLTDAAREWEEGGREAGDVYRGARLAAALDWRAGHEQDLNRSERAFLEAGAAAERSELEVARRRTRRLRALALGLVALVLVTGASALLAVRQADRAESERRLVLARQLAAQADRLVERQPDSAILVGLQSLSLARDEDPEPQVPAGLVTGLARLTHASRLLLGHTDQVHDVAFRPDGKVLASAGWDGTVRLWDVRSGRPRGAPLDGGGAGLNGVAFNPEGTLLATAGEDGMVRIWDAASGRPRGEPLRGHGARVNAVRFSPDGRLLASASEDGTARLWDVRSGRQVRPPLSRHIGEVQDVAFSPDGALLATGGADGTARLWDVASGRQAGAPLTGHRDDVYGVGFSRDGALLATASADKTVRVWDVASRRLRGRPLAGHTEGVWQPAFSRDGRLIATAGADGSVRLWETATGRPHDQPLAGHTNTVQDVEFSPDGKLLATAGWDNSVRLWEVAPTVSIGRPLLGHSQEVLSARFSPTGGLLASAGVDAGIRLWDMPSGRPRGRPLRGHRGEVNALAFTANGRLLASAGADATVRLWDMPSGRPHGRPLRGHGKDVFSVAFSPDGKLLASASEDLTARIWETSSGRPHGPPLQHPELVNGVAFDPKRPFLATAGGDHKVRLWDTRSGRAHGTPLEGHTDDVYSVRFSPDGRLLASASADRTVRLWDMPSGRPHGQPLRGHTDAVYEVAFRDNAVLATASTDGTARLWDIATGRPRGRALSGHAGPLYGLDFAPGGSLLATAGGDATVRLWNYAFTAWRTYGCRLLARNLSMAEWNRSAPAGLPYERTCPDAPAGPGAPADAPPAAY